MFRSDDKTRIRNSSRCPRQANSRLTIRKRQKPNQPGHDKRPRKNRNHRTQASRRRRHVMHFPRKSIFRLLLILRIDNHRRRHKKQRQKSHDQADDDVTHGEVSIEQKSCEEPNRKTKNPDDEQTTERGRKSPFQWSVLTAQKRISKHIRIHLVSLRDLVRIKLAHHTPFVSFTCISKRRKTISGLERPVGQRIMSLR